ncbi:MAG: tetratricopeptide repeat protein [Verrucomicrobiota bacterium]|nr:tetratricopeptide repeat protein [Verrucomicrobiota bacterium]
MQGDRFRAFILVVVGFIVRMPALQGLPVWDDDYLVTDNPFSKSPLLILEAFRHYLFPDSLSHHYRPVQNISLAFDYFVWNSSSYGYHLTNVLLHLASGLLLFFLLRKLLPRFAVGAPSTSRLCAFLIALVWVVHPVHSAAVDYISGRADSLAFVFAAGGWLLYLRGRDRKRLRNRVVFYLVAMLSGLLSLCSREIACIWLALFLLHLCVFESGITRRKKFIALGCCLFLLGSYAALRHLPAPRPAPPSTQPWGAPTRSVLMLRALGDYGRLIAWPSTLYMERSVLDSENYVSAKHWRNSVATEYLSILGALVLVALAYGSYRKGRGRSLRIFGALWFAFGYLPISNLIDLNATVAEHWLYLPSVGLLMFLCGCALDLPAWARRAAVACALVAVAGFGVRSYFRSGDWLTPRIFYQRTMAAGGSSMRVALNLGMIYTKSGEYAKAETVFRRVLQITPDYALARTNLAEVLYRQGKHAEAEAMFAASSSAAPEARKDNPRTWIAALNLAHIRHNEQDDAGALVILDRARADYPGVWEIIRFESEIVRKVRGPDEALRLVADFARDNWWHYGATIALGQLLAEKGDVEAAVKQLRFASWLDVHDAEALDLVAAMRMRQNRLEEARVAQARAVARQPDQPSQYRLLSEILFKMGRTAEARLAVAKMVGLEALASPPLAAN